MKAFKSFLLLLLVGFSWSSCETEVDLFTEPKETAVVYALLDQFSPVQYFRINPTFIGEGDANQLAGDPDLTNYQEGEIKVKLIDLETDEVYDAEQTDEKKLRDDGIFDPNIRLFKINTPLDTVAGKVVNTVIVGDRRYRLWVQHVPSGNVFTSETVVGDANSLLLTAPDNSKRLISAGNIKFYTDQYINFQFKFTDVPDARKYLLEMNYYYTENGDDSLSKDKFIHLKLGEITTDGDAESFILRYNGEQFYRILQNSLPVNTPEIGRVGRKIDLFLTVFGEEISTYIDVQNAVQTGISQERPSYTNIDNGLGVFSYRTTLLFENFLFDDNSVNQLLEGPYTKERFSCAVHFTPVNQNGFLECR